MQEIKIPIADRKRILNLLYEYSGHDFRYHAPGLIGHRLEMVYRQMEIQSVDDLCFNLEKYESYRERLLQIMYVPSTEILRDPSCWQEIQSVVLKKLRKAETIKIWLPLCTSGEELYSLRIILNEAEVGYKSKILAYTPTHTHKDYILDARYSSKKISPLEKNLEITENGIRLNRYFNYGEKGFSVNTKLFEDDVTLEVKRYMTSDFQADFHLVIFRNRLIELGKTGHTDALLKITNSLDKGGFLVTGVNEELGKTIGNKYKLISKNEPIYKKTVF